MHFDTNNSKSFANAIDPSVYMSNDITIVIRHTDKQTPSLNISSFFLSLFFRKLQEDQIVTKEKVKNGEKFYNSHTYHSAYI